MNYETIIIGAGPAGLIAGKYLKNALILDKKKEVGKPVQCGEGISVNALRIQGIKPDISWICCKIHKVKRIMPNGKVVGRFHKEPIGYVIDRERFEKYLAQNVKAKIKLNTEIVDLKFRNNLWEVTAENGYVFKSKYIIGADGPNSICRRKIFKEKLEIIPAIEYLIGLEKEIEINSLKIYLDNNIDHGYAWIFPKTKNKANIGICGKGNLLNEFNKFLENIVKKYYGEYKILENRSGIIPIQKGDVEVFKDNIILVGDAAGLADPFFKGGMNQAMYSAKIAAQCILKDKVSFYESQIKSMPFADLRLSEASKIFYSLDNEMLNELGCILADKEVLRLTTFSEITMILSKPNLRKNVFKALKAFLIWKKKHDNLW